MKQAILTPTHKDGKWRLVIEYGAGSHYSFYGSLDQVLDGLQEVINEEETFEEQLLKVDFLAEQARELMDTVDQSVTADNTTISFTDGRNND